MQIEINIFRDHPCAGYKCRDLSSIHFADDYYLVIPIRGNSTTYLRRYEIESTERCVHLNYESILHTYVFSFFFFFFTCELFAKLRKREKHFIFNSRVTRNSFPVAREIKKIPRIISTIPTIEIIRMKILARARAHKCMVIQISFLLKVYTARFPRIATDERSETKGRHGN